MTTKFKPILQGKFDGMCGFYACVNAIKHILPHLLEGELNMLHEKITDEYTQQELGYIYKYGIDVENFSKLGAFFIKCVYENFNKKIKCVKILGKHKMSDNLKLFRDHFKYDNVCFIAFISLKNENHTKDDNISHHWTTITDVSDKYIYLSDSTSLSQISINGIVARNDPSNKDIKSSLTLDRDNIYCLFEDVNINNPINLIEYNSNYINQIDKTKLIAKILECSSKIKFKNKNKIIQELFNQHLPNLNINNNQSLIDQCNQLNIDTTNIDRYQCVEKLVKYLIE